MKHVADLYAVTGYCEVSEIASGADFDGYTLLFGKYLWFQRDNANIFPWGVKIVDTQEEWRFQDLETAIAAAYTLEFALRGVAQMADAATWRPE